MPTDLIENFSNKLFENRPAQLTAPFIIPIAMVTVLVPPPKFAIKSLNSKPNEEKHPKYEAWNDSENESEKTRNKKQIQWAKYYEWYGDRYCNHIPPNSAIWSNLLNAILLHCRFTHFSLFLAHLTSDFNKASNVIVLFNYFIEFAVSQYISAYFFLVLFQIKRFTVTQLSNFVIKQVSMYSINSDSTVSAITQTCAFEYLLLISNYRNSSMNLCTGNFTLKLNGQKCLRHCICKQRTDFLVCSILLQLLEFFFVPLWCTNFIMLYTNLYEWLDLCDSADNGISASCVTFTVTS